MLQNKLVLFMIVLSCQLYADDSWKVYDDTELAIVEITIAPEDLEWIYENVESDSLHPATIHFQNAHIDETVDSVGFRLRGNTSRVSAKKSFKVDFNHFFPGRDFFDVEKLNLNGEHNDPSIVRSKVCWDFFQDIGMVGSRAAHAKVFINGNYYGLYVSVEHLDDSFLSRNYADDSGNLWKCLWPADLSYRGDDPEDYHPYYDDKRPYELKTNKDEYDYSKLARMIRILHQTPDSLEMVLNVKEALQYFAMNILTGSWDDYRFLKNNYYLYHNPSDDLIHWIPYDYDNTFSIDWFNIDWSTIDPYEYAVIDNDGRPLTEYLFAQDRYRNLFTHFMEFYLESLLDLDSLNSRLGYFISHLYDAAEGDVYRTMDYGFTMDDFVDSYGDQYQDQHVKQGIMEFLIDRKSSLSDQLYYENVHPTIYEAALDREIAVSNQYIQVEAAVFGDVETLYCFYTLEGEFPWNSTQLNFTPDSLSSLVEDHDKWTTTISVGQPGTYYWYLFANSSESSDRFPVYDYKTFEVVETIDTQSVVVNELLAKNETVNMDEAGEYDDWIELYNNSNETIDLSNFFLTDKVDNLTKWQFPDSGVVVNPGEFLLIWCDEDQEQGPLHTNFKLSSNGEFLGLIGPDGVSILDSLTFPQQDEDVSFGRSAGNPDMWGYMLPTPGGGNTDLSIQSDSPHPNHFELVNIFPNPFNSTINLEYKVHNPGSEIKISLYSLLGREVYSLHHWVNISGEDRIQIKFRDGMSTGLYLLQLNYNDQIQSEKILYLK